MHRQTRNNGPGDSIQDEEGKTSKQQIKRLSKGKSNKVETERSVENQFDSMKLNEDLNQYPDNQLCADCLMEKRQIQRKLTTLTPADISN
jgi:hypothetical protein